MTHKLFWGSSYDRGLDILLFMWQDIKKKYPDAELHICYGWGLFDQMNANNPERMKWKESVEKMMKQEGVFDYGRVGKEELRSIRRKCTIWAYPTYFTEINCITALDCQGDGLVPVVCNFTHKIDGKDVYTALNETVGAGLKVEGHISDMAVQEKFKKSLLGLMGDVKQWKVESRKAKKFARKYKWSEIAGKWEQEFIRIPSTPKLSVITITIRQGFWNMMANNLACQTYKNFEWVIVDGFPQNRAKLAREYGEKYGLNIKYVRDKKPDVKRRYGLVNANNTAIDHASGELIVWLQDFILLPDTGLEQLVDIHRHHPNDLIAPCDIYHYPKHKPNLKSEDWFDGKVDVIGDFQRKNQRILGNGMVQTDDPLEFEMNYGAIPTKVLKKLNGWWEFMDDGLGYDNTEIAYRAMKLGSKIWLDDGNIAVCIDHWETLKDSPQNIPDRHWHLNPPRYFWLEDQTERGNIPIIRDKKVDNAIKLIHDLPKLKDLDKIPLWFKNNYVKIARGWGHYGK